MDVHQKAVLNQRVELLLRTVTDKSKELSAAISGGFIDYVQFNRPRR